MKDIDFSQFQGVWEASRLLENICLYKAMFGTPPFYNVKTDDNEERPLKRVMRERIISVLKAYDKSIYTACDDFFNADFSSSCLGTIISEHCSKEKFELLKKILKSYFSYDLLERYDIIKLENNFSRRMELFRSLLNIKVTAMYENLHRRQYLEWHDSIYMTIIAAKMFYKYHVSYTDYKDVSILLILMGEDYDKSYSEEYLIKNYAYPAITNKELYTMDIDWLANRCNK